MTRSTQRRRSSSPWVGAPVVLLESCGRSIPRASVGAAFSAIAALAGAAHAQFQAPPVRGLQPAPVPQAISPYTNQTAPVVICFAEGTDPAYVQRMSGLTAMENQVFAGITDYYLGNARWSGAQGTPRALTWSFVPDGLPISGGAGEAATNSTLFATMDSAFAGQAGGAALARAYWTNRFSQMFDRWHQLAGVSFTRVTSGGNDWDDGAAWGAGGAAGARGDIRISMHNIDGQSNILAYTYYPSSGDMVIDSSDIGFFAGTANQNRFLRDTVTHELGHALGLNHVCSSNTNQLMEPFINTNFDGPMQDDIRGVQRWYGDPLESNDSAAAATPLGSISVGGSINAGGSSNAVLPLPAPLTGTNDPSAALFSIDASGKTDWFSVNASGALNLTVTATPVGSSYDDTAQASNGSCPSGTTTNALAIADLSVAIFAGNGTTMLGTSNNAAAGAAETLSNVTVNAGANYVRISAANAPVGSQLYRLSITGSNSNPVCPAFTQQPSGGNLCSGDFIDFTVAVTGSPAPSLQWKHNGLTIPGATSPTYTILSLDPSDSGDYVCVATNSCGSAPSNPAVLVVQSEPLISTQPQSQTVAGGDPFSLSMESSFTSSYQWYHDGNLVAGATNPTYSVAHASASDSGEYLCVLGGDCGGGQTDPATITVGGAPPSCYANCDSSVAVPFLNVGDFTCFLTRFASGDPYANCDGSTAAPTLNVADFGCFLTAFATGCSAP
jgi:hypothetical protein